MSWVVAATGAEQKSLGTNGLLLVGSLFLAVGLVGMFDILGLARSHASIAARFARGITALPPWRWIESRDPDVHFRRAYWANRVGGGFFAAVGLAMAIAGLLRI